MVISAVELADDAVIIAQGSLICGMLSKAIVAPDSRVIVKPNGDAEVVVNGGKRKKRPNNPDSYYSLCRRVLESDEYKAEGATIEEIFTRLEQAGKLGRNDTAEILQTQALVRTPSVFYKQKNGKWVLKKMMKKL